VTYTVWHPPVPEVEEDVVDISEKDSESVLQSNALVFALGGLVVLLSIVLAFTRRQNSIPRPQKRPTQAPELFVPPPIYDGVPAAPDFSKMGQYVPPSNNDWDSNKWK